MIKIMSIQRLMKATSNLGPTAKNALQNQIEHTRERLRTGVDLGGNAFAGYKDDRPHPGHERPLMFAARLFDDMDFHVSPVNGGGVEVTGTITGEAAKIARYQNFNRRFLGYSDEDRHSAVMRIMLGIREAGRGIK